KKPGILHVMVDQIANLLTALSRIQRFGATLHRIRHAVRLGTPTALPKWMQRKSPTVAGSRDNGFWHHGKSATHTGETTVFRKTNAEFRDRKCTPRTRHRRAKAHRVRARNRPTARAARAMRPYPLDCLENIDRRGRGVRLAVRARNDFALCRANNGCPHSYHP